MTRRHIRSELRLRNRRGSILVWFGMTIVLLLMVTAVVVDYGYWYMGLTELQTAADAAALRGARRLQMSAKSGNALAVDVDTVTVNFSLRNDAQHQNVVIDSTQVNLAFYTPPAAGGTPTQPNMIAASWPAAGPNAVVVDNQQSGIRLFGRVYPGLKKPTLGKRAVAWRAYLNAGKCVRPWGMPMSQLTSKLTGGVDTSYRQLTGTEIKTLNQMSDAQRTFVMVPPEKTVKVDYATLPYTGQWAGIRFNRDATSTGNQGMSEFQRLSAGGCLTSGDAFGVGDYANTDLPSGALESKMQQAVEDGGAGPSRGDFPPTCVYTNKKANCYANAAARTAGIIGSVVNVAYTSAPDRNGSEQVEAYMLGQFKIMCLYSGTGDTCDYNVAPFKTTGYPQGTIVGMVVADFFTKLTPDIELGNLPSTSSRLILVR